MQTLTCFAPSFLAPIVGKTFGFKMRISEQAVQALKREGKSQLLNTQESAITGDAFCARLLNHDILILHFTAEKN